MRQAMLNSASHMRQPVLFLSVGFIGTSVHYIILAVMVTNYSVEPVTASTCGAVAGAVIVHTLKFSDLSKQANLW